MHIPDGYLSPVTCAATCVFMAPLWAWASSSARKVLKGRHVPVIALSAGFVFVAMMFNIPIPGGTTGHLLGGPLLGILLGPGPAVLSMSVVLAVQALVFGDGGVTTFAANCLSMAVLAPCVAWLFYKITAGHAISSPRRAPVAAAVSAYLGVSAAAFAQAILLGIQPVIAAGNDGRPLYCPFGLRVTIPAVLGSHLLFFGILEAIMTGLVMAYLGSLSADPFLRPPRHTPPEKRRIKGMVWGLVALALLTPLGLLLPALAGSGSSWGEWDAGHIAKWAGLVPSGLARMESLWHAPMPDYGPPGFDGGLGSASAWYVVSGILGAGLVGVVGAALWRAFSTKKGDHGSAS